MKKICQYVFAGCLVASGFTQAQTSIVVNQAGYYPLWPKSVAVIDPEPTMKFLELWDTEKQKLVKRIRIPTAKQDIHSKQYIATVNFSHIQRQGSYRWQIDKIQHFRVRSTKITI